MLTSNGYSLIYYKNRNQIVIGLPQTWRTLTNTLEPVVDRRIDLEEKDLAILLNATQAIFLNGTSTWTERKMKANIATNIDNAMSTETRGDIMPDSMMFPKTVDEFMEKYKIVDTEEVYTNGAELVPIFRMEQWFEHEEAEPVKHGHWVVDEDGNIKCSECGHSGVGDNYCERCGAKMNEVTENA